MQKNNIVLIIITVVTLMALVIGATYAYFATGNLNITNVANVNTVTERNNMVFDTLGGGMILNITAANMVEAKNGNVAAQNSTTLTVNFTANTTYSMVCSYDIVYEWTSSDKYTSHSSGVTSSEFTIQGTLASNAHASQGTNTIGNERDLSALTYTNNSATVVIGAQIDGTGSTTSTAVWTLSSKFYNVNANQSALSGKTYAGKFRVANVSCVTGLASFGPTNYWYDKTTCTSSSPCAFPNYGGTLQTSGTATGSNVYIGKDSSQNYECATINGHEVCLTQPYTQYGLEGHTSGTDFTAAQNASAASAIEQVFIAAGVTGYTCTGITTSARCAVGNKRCGVQKAGYLFCIDDDASKKCYVNKNGSAYCT